jgi:multidrug efflux pump subunit AcrB
MMRIGPAGRIGQFFINSKLTPIIVVVTLLLGAQAVMKTPREEEPQITVPFADVITAMPGASAAEVEKRVTMPLEKLMWEISGVEYVYSMSRPGASVVSVRFYVGENEEDSFVKLYNKVMGNLDKMPPGTTQPMVKTKSIDDVAALTLTLWSEKRDWGELRRLAGQLADEIKKVEKVSEIEIAGGRKRQVKVRPDVGKMAARGVTLTGLAGAIRQASVKLPAGTFESGNAEIIVESGEFLDSAEAVGAVVVGAAGGRPVYVSDVADIEDGVDETVDYVLMGAGPAAAEKGISIESGGPVPAVTIAVSKRKGADAARLVGAVMERVEAVRSEFMPSDVNVTVTRNYGATAHEKVNELIKHLAGAIIAVTVVVLLSMGWRAAIVILLSVPITFSLTLFIYYMYGYTLNRITLFALVFVTGIVIDDSIIVVENIHRHFKMRKLPPLQAAITAVNEVGNPTILATLTVIASVFPMYFVTGLMGPYMRPMPVGASLAMTISLLVAFIAAPYLAFRLLKRDDAVGDEEYDIRRTVTFKAYAAIMEPLMDSPRKSWIFIGAVAALLAGAVSLLGFRAVTVKMLPYDNKSEFQIVLDMPEGATLESSLAAAKDVAATLENLPEATDYQIYAGRGAPINFNGLVRQYYMRRGSNVADIQVNLLDKHGRKASSHDVAKRARGPAEAAAAKHGARVKIAEVPPGPPVMATLVAEVYGPDDAGRRDMAARVLSVFEAMDGVVDADTMTEDDAPKLSFDIDKRKAALTGVSPAAAAETIGIAVGGADVALAHSPDDYEPAMVNVRLRPEERSGAARLMSIKVASASGEMVPLGELATARESVEDKTIFRKNLKRVEYVTGDVAGRYESPVYAMLDMGRKISALEMPEGYSVTQFYSTQPPLESDFGIKWDGEWQITYEVFRDLGIAFAAVLVIIYVLIVAWFQSFVRPMVMMTAIPLTLIGILPGHWALGAFFTATSMIGFIALAGIIVRNSILLIDFAKMRTDEGMSLKEAALESGAVRLRPIVLTAGTVVVGAVPIYLDPIFQGLAVSLMTGAVASTALALVLVPLLYYMVESAGRKDEAADAFEDAPVPEKEDAPS